MTLLRDVITTSRAIASRVPSELNGEELAAVLDAGEILQSYLKQARAEAERRIETSEPVPGWELIPGRGRSSVVDTAAAFRALAPLLTERAFLDCCSVALGKLVDAIRVAEGVSEDEAKDILGEYLKGNIMKSAGTPTLSRAPRQIELTVLPTHPEAA